MTLRQRLAHKLFGHDFVAIAYYPSTGHFVRMDAINSLAHGRVVRVVPNRDKGAAVMVDGHLLVIEQPSDAVWLTCSPYKYLEWDDKK